MIEWWKKRVVYQIYPRSFMDSNGDGIGDIQGIISKLDVLHELGVGILWLSPVYCSPNEDNGYDISDYRNINPEYGTLADMDELIAEASKRDIKIVMDLVVNHTSSQHEWFKKSCQGVEPYKDYYIWRKKPNNWTSFFGGKAWQYVESRGEYYLHLFAKGQPDLNYDNPAVIEEVKGIMRFWLDRGISGFRCDVINILHKTTLRNGRPRIALVGREHYLSQPGTHRILKELRKDVLSKYDCFTVGESVMVTPKDAKQLCNGELDMVFSFEHMNADCFFIKWLLRKFSPIRLYKSLAKWEKKVKWNTIYLENHDQPRSVSRFGDEKNHPIESAKALAVLLLTLKGTPFIFEGEELGMTNFDMTSMDQLNDVESKNVYSLARKLRLSENYCHKMIWQKSRDNARTPMQWSAQKHGGFTTGTPWLKVNDNHTTINFDCEHDDPNSVWSFYKELIALRNSTPALQYGTFKVSFMTKNVFAYERAFEGKKIGVIVNLSNKKQRVPCVGYTIMSNYGRTQLDCELEPYEAAVLRR